MESMQQKNWGWNREEWLERRRHRRRFFGIALAGFATLVLLSMFGVLPPIVYSLRLGWPLILVIIGIIFAAKSNFRGNAWWILILIGGVFMFPDILYFGVPIRRLLWPVVLLGVGLVMIFRKRDYAWVERCQPGMRGRRHHGRGHRMDPNAIVTTDSDSVQVDITFGGRKEIVTSKAFKGGVVRASFAGVELNLTSAEPGIQPMILEIHASFAGVELIVPSQWEVYNEIDPFAGNVEDQRRIRTYENPSHPQTLILRGSCSFGSISIKSF
jgi:hypothetical protein